MQGTPQDLNFKSLIMDSNVKNGSQSMVPLNEKACLSTEWWLTEEFILNWKFLKWIKWMVYRIIYTGRIYRR
jgi:hypothetical protein